MDFELLSVLRGFQGSDFMVFFRDTCWLKLNGNGGWKPWWYKQVLMVSIF